MRRDIDEETSVLLTAERETVVADDKEKVEPASEVEAEVGLLSRVDGALRRAGWDALRHVQIYLDESHVTLRGRVRSYYHKQLAQHVTLCVDGVKRVQNELRVE
jgi:osmotically-inducible protein OsmY